MSRSSLGQERVHACPMVMLRHACGVASLLLLHWSLTCSRPSPPPWRCGGATNCSIEEIKRLCLEQLELMSEKKLLKILEGEHGADSDSDEEANASEEKAAIESISHETLVKPLQNLMKA
ncbi:UNVERIFIED_CONTAM: hypothetical protein K2H54_038218 [Gekko kuhli]